MKRLLLAALLIGMMSGCKQSNVKKASTKKYYATDHNTFEAVEIEGCEYFVCDVYNGSVLCHKGNCKNPIHP